MTRDEPTSSTTEPTRGSTLHVGEHLRRTRLHLNLTQGEVARNLFSVAYVSGVERGRIRPSLDALAKLAERLDIPVAKLLTENDYAVRSAGSPAKQRTRAPIRHLLEVENSLREAQMLAFQDKHDEAIDLLLHLSSQHLSSHEMALLYWLLACCYNHEGRAEEARRTAEDAIPLAERAGERELAERLRLQLGHAFSLLHSHTRALEQYRECLRAVEEQVICDPAFRLDVLVHLGAQYDSGEEYDQAIASLLQAADVAEEVTQPAALGSNYSNISQALAAKGDHAGARSYAVRSLGAYREAKNRRTVTSVYTELGTVLAHSGQVEEALAQLNRAHASAMGQRDVQSIAEAARNLALVYLEQKRIGEANKAAEEALSAAQRLGDATLQAKCLLVLARVQEARKHTSKAAESFELAIELLRSVETPDATVWLRQAYAQFSEYLEQHGESERAFGMLKLAYKASQHGEHAPRDP